jgi:CheY-like chemotaxis protein
MWNRLLRLCLRHCKCHEVKTLGHVVVVVEDETITRLVACATLADAGFHVLETDNIDHALALLRARAREVHAIFTDVHVPGSTNGLALAPIPNACGRGSCS